MNTALVSVLALLTVSAASVSGCGGGDPPVTRVQVETSNIGGVSFADTKAKLESNGVIVYATRCGNFDPLLPAGGGIYADGPPRFFEFEVAESDADAAVGLGFKRVTEPMLALRTPREGRPCNPNE